MPKIFPFRAQLYSETFRNEIGKLISPPYDVISAEGFRNLKNLHSFQSVRLALTEDGDDARRYEKMRDLYRQWKKEKVLVTTPTPAFYLIEDTFETDGKKSRRVGFVALLEVTPFEKKEVLPHEYTLSGPKKDRFELLKMMRAEISQIFLCYKDASLTLEKIYDKISSATAPHFEGTDSSDIHRRLWTLTEREDIEQLQKLLSDHPVLIADGHHRYETAVAFSKESRFAQVYLTNLNTPGFAIHPIHRLFALPESTSQDKFFAQLEKKFGVAEWKKNMSVGNLLDEKKSGELKLLCQFQSSGKIFVLSQKRTSPDDAEIFAIHRDIFEGILGWNVKELAKGTIQYEHDTNDFLKTLASIKNGVGLFLPPTDLNVVMNLAERGERMPQKSTFFYPKLASGLVNYDLDEH
jgi:uncharacterized protein (DUF1015 family)